MRLALLLLPAVAFANPTSTTSTPSTTTPTPNPWPITMDMSVCSAFPSPPCYLEVISFYRNQTYDGGFGPYGPGAGQWQYYPAQGIVNLVARDGTVFTGWATPSTAGQRCFSGIWTAAPGATGAGGNGFWDGCVN
jgi:hypothetical protein